MFSVAPNILLAPNMTQNAERKHRTQDANTAHNRLRQEVPSPHAQHSSFPVKIHSHLRFFYGVNYSLNSLKVHSHLQFSQLLRER